MPVQTGFEGGSKPDRRAFEVADYEPPDAGSIEDLFDEDFDRRLAEPDDDQGMDDLFIDDEVIVPDGPRQEPSSTPQPARAGDRYTQGHPEAHHPR